METTDIIALCAGVAGLLTGLAGLVASMRANGIAKDGNELARQANKVATEAAEDARSATQDAYRTEARGLMNEALNAVHMAFDESGGSSDDKRSPRATLSTSATSLTELAQYLDNDSERSALVQLAALYRDLSGLTAQMDQARQRADNAAPENYTGEANTLRLAAVDDVTSRWLECEHRLHAAERATRSELAAGSRSEPKHPGSGNTIPPKAT